MTDTSCSIAGCDRRWHCRDWCSMHYRRWWRTGNPMGRAGVLPIERFEKFFCKGSGCWLWTGGLDTGGYGIFTVMGTNMGAHRWAYEHYVGSIPDGLVIDHLCRRRNCVNPDHMEPVTVAENNLRGVGVGAINARKTHCKHGHPFDDDNTYVYNDIRYCATCVARRSREYRARRSVQ